MNAHQDCAHRREWKNHQSRGAQRRWIRARENTLRSTLTATDRCRSLSRKLRNRCSNWGGGDNLEVMWTQRTIQAARISITSMSPAHERTPGYSGSIEGVSHPDMQFWGPSYCEKCKTFNVLYGSPRRVWANNYMRLTVKKALHHLIR